MGIVSERPWLPPDVLQAVLLVIAVAIPSAALWLLFRQPASVPIPVKVQPLSVYGPWEDERFRIEQHKECAQGGNLVVTTVFDKALQREVTIVGLMNTPAIISVYDVPRQQTPPPTPSPKVEAPPVPEKKPEAEKK